MFGPCRHAVAILALVGSSGASAALTSIDPGSPGMDTATIDGDAAGIERFTPRDATSTLRLDYSIWATALQSFVINMGPSLRKFDFSSPAYTGTHLMRGHDSLYSMEANRVAFSMLEPEVIASFTEYREDLEAIGTRIDIASLDRNEQLAFWLNLHNVAVIEQIARAYPVIHPSRIEIGGVPFDRARFITVDGVALSPHDIRTRIVYPNWKDPRVIYGFFRGDIGSPSIQREAFDADALSWLLQQSGDEFVNSLRGTERRGRTLHVSRVFDEAAPFYFPDFEKDLRAHLMSLAGKEVREELERSDAIRPTVYELDIADLAGGEKLPNYGNVSSTNREGEAVLTSIRVPLNIQIFVMQREEKRRQLSKRGLIGRVIVLPSSSEDPNGLGAEVE